MRNWDSTTSRYCLEWMLMGYSTLVLISHSVCKVVRHTALQPTAPRTKLSWITVRYNQWRGTYGSKFLGVPLNFCKTTEIFIDTKSTRH